MSYSKSITSLKISLSGLNVTRVPFLSDFPISLTLESGFPFL